MKINTQETYIELEDERDDIKDFASYLSYIVPRKFQENNLVVNLLKYKELTLDQLLFFLSTSDSHREAGYSFVIVNNAISPDDLPDELVVVPTQTEAQDIISMEQMERDLGF